MKLISEDALKKVWEIEELPQGRYFIKEEQACEEPYRRTTKLNQEGQFVVKLPFKDNTTPLGDSFQQAKRRIDTLFAALLKQNAALLETKLSTPDIQPSSKNTWIFDTWRRSRTPKSPSNPEKASTCITTAS